MASVLSDKIGDGVVYAWDGSVAYDWNGAPRISNKQDHFEDVLIGGKHYPDRDPFGQIMYQNGKPVDNLYYQGRLLEDPIGNVIGNALWLGEDVLQRCIGNE